MKPRKKANKNMTTKIKAADNLDQNQRQLWADQFSLGNKNKNQRIGLSQDIHRKKQR